MKSADTHRIRRELRRGLGGLLAVLAAALCAAVGAPGTAQAASYVPISGAGSTWAENAITDWITGVKQYGMRINYKGTGSSDGRKQFLQETVDYADSDIPFQPHPTDGSSPESPKAGTYAYMPVVAGGTAFMYHLTIGGRRVTNLRLSGSVIAKIFTGKITRWNDPAIVKDNPGLSMPAEKVVPVIRSDGSGSSAQFSLWMQAQQASVWNSFCASNHKCGAGATSYWPNFPGSTAQSGDLGVAGYVAASYAEGAIGYVEYSYATNSGWPVAKILNAAGYYVEPTPYNVAVALTKARINTNPDPAVYLTQNLTDVYSYTDHRSYPLSSYSYFILPTSADRKDWNSAKGATLAAFSYYMECQGQQDSADLGYSPLPLNLVQASFNQILKIPGAVKQSIQVTSCNNPTFDGHNLSSNKLAEIAPFPQPCDRQGPTQCTTGTGGAKSSTPVKPGAQGGNGGGAGESTGGAGSGAGSGPGSGPSAGLHYDPNTDQYVSDAGTTGGDSQVAAIPVWLTAHRGWTSTQTLMLIAALVTVGLVLAPALTTRLLHRRAAGGEK